MLYLKDKTEFYIERVKDLTLNERNGTPPLAFVRTYGCQQNVSDSEKFKGMLQNMGFSLTGDPSLAELILFNTCAIREHAQDKVFGNIGALKYYKRGNPDLIIAICGCMTEQEHIVRRLKNRYPFVDIVFGTGSMEDFPYLIYERMSTGKRVFCGSPVDMPIPEGLPIHRDGKFKAWLPIMYGCNNFCSYCIVPYVRGRERSRDSKNILSEANLLISRGYKDITLLGQNVNSYGKDLGQGASFPALLRDISKIPGDYVLRFMTSHPKDVDHEMIDAIAANQRISRHLHLPVQSGSDTILKRMNRVYDRAGYLQTVDYARRKIDDVSLTSDIIVGFPGETYEDFKHTLSLVKEVEYTSLFTFIYSPRKGTKAAAMEDPVPLEQKKEWFRELLEVQEKIASKRCKSMVGKTERALVEGRTSNGKHLYARTSGNIIIEFDGEDNLVGSFKRLKINRALNWILEGSVER